MACVTGAVNEEEDEEEGGAGVQNNPTPVPAAAVMSASDRVIAPAPSGLQNQSEVEKAAG